MDALRPQRHEKSAQLHRTRFRSLRRSFVQRIIEAVEKVAAYPHLGRRVPEADDEAVREILFQKYRIVYRVEPARILVLMVIHGARDMAQVASQPWEIE